MLTFIDSKFVLEKCIYITLKKVKKLEEIFLTKDFFEMF